MMMRCRRYGEHDGIGFRSYDLRFEGHELVATEGMHHHPLSGPALRERCIQSGLPRAQAIDSDDHIAGSYARSLRGAAFEHVRDGGVIVMSSRANAEHRESRSAFRASRSAAFVLRRLRRA